MFMLCASRQLSNFTMLLRIQTKPESTQAKLFCRRQEDVICFPKFSFFQTSDFRMLP